MSVWVNASYPRHICSTFKEVLVHNRGRLTFETHFIGSAQLMAGQSFPFRILPQDGRILSFEALSMFRAVVFLPWSPENCMLRHLFKINIPMLVPGRGLLRHMVHISNLRYVSAVPYNLPMPGSDRQAVQAVHPYDPFLDTVLPPGDVIGIDARKYWAEYSEFLLVPHLLYFESAAELLIRLYSMDPVLISASMHRSYMQDLVEMHSFWADTLPLLLRRV